MSRTTYPLSKRWNMYYHLQHDRSWTTDSYKHIMNIDAMEKLIILNETIPEHVVVNCMLFVMREGVDPVWEDPSNSVGGCFSFRVPNKHTHSVWQKLLYLLCGESLCVDPNNNKYINGLTISPKKDFCVLKIWTNTLLLKDPNIIVSIENLNKSGCLFKKHEPEF